MSFWNRLRLPAKIASAILAVAVLCSVGFGVHKYNVARKPVFTELSKASQDAVQTFMWKYPHTASYMTVLRFDYGRNTRVPIFRAFNDKEVRTTVYGRLKGGDGALPIFLKDDITNNNQMITVIQGGLACDPYDMGGLSRVWPDLKKKFVISCRVAIPTGATTVGYMVLHLDETPSSYEIEAIKQDFIGLSKFIDMQEIHKN